MDQHRTKEDVEREFGLLIERIREDPDMLKRLYVGVVSSRVLRNYVVEIGVKSGRFHVRLLGEQAA